MRSVAADQNGRRRYGRSTAPLRFMYVCGLTSRTLTLPTDAGRDARLAVLSPAVETPNVGEVVDDPPADVVTRALVLLARDCRVQR